MYTQICEPKCVSTYIMGQLCESSHYSDKSKTQKANTLTLSNCLLKPLSYDTEVVKILNQYQIAMAIKEGTIGKNTLNTQN